ncbi:hypothetical protein Tco_0024179 [Tanacetum coccineum]
MNEFYLSHASHDPKNSVRVEACDSVKQKQVPSVGATPCLSSLLLSLDAQKYFPECEDSQVFYMISHPQLQFGTRTDNQEKDEKQSQNDKTGLGMKKTVKDKANKAGKSIKSKSQQKSQLVKVQVNPEAKKSTNQEI